MAEIGWDSKEVCRICGVSIRQLNHWDRHGIICPSVAPGRGSGMRRRYNRADLTLLKLAVELRSIRMPLATVSDAVATARTKLTSPRPITDILSQEQSQVLVVDRSSDVVMVNEGQLQEILARRTVATVVRLDRLRAEIEQRIDGAQSTSLVSFDLSGKTYQATVSPTASGKLLEATSRAFLPHRGVGKTMAEAIGALKTLILSDESDRESRPRPRQARDAKATTAPARRPKGVAGASSWGDGW